MEYSPQSPFSNGGKHLNPALIQRTVPSSLGYLPVLILQGFNCFAGPDDINLNVASEISDPGAGLSAAELLPPVREASICYRSLHLGCESSAQGCSRILGCRIRSSGRKEPVVTDDDEDKEKRHEEKRGEIRPSRCGRRDLLFTAERLTAPGTAYCIGFIRSVALRTIQGQFSAGPQEVQR